MGIHGALIKVAMVSSHLSKLGFILTSLCSDGLIFYMYDKNRVPLWDRGNPSQSDGDGLSSFK